MLNKQGALKNQSLRYITYTYSLCILVMEGYLLFEMLVMVMSKADAWQARRKQRPVGAAASS